MTTRRKRANWNPAATPPSTAARAGIGFGGAVLALAVVAGEVFGDPGAPMWQVILDLGVGVGGAVALPFSMRRPLVAAVGCVALSVLSPGATPLVGAALVWLAQHAELRVAVGMGAAAVAGQIARGVWRPTEGGLLDWWLLAVVAGFAAVVGWGAWSKAHKQVLADLVERARRAEEEQAARVAEARRAERERIAREMHDVLAHRLSLLATYAGAVEYNREAPPDRLVEAAEVIRRGSHEALVDLRQVIDVLRGDDDPADGATGPPQPTLGDLAGLAEESRQAGVAVTLELLDDPMSVPTSIGRTAYRLVQEAMTNVRKHAPGEPVQVVVAGRPGDTLDVEVRNPLGPESAEKVPGSGTGLVGMAERVRLAGGLFDAGPDRSGGFTVRASLPWPE